uniref:Ig-like domain-containing protein n=1 Tax=Monopterus albus TaxID=43700 RepID=A0A3Q3Q6Q2_MONAL
VCAHKHSAVFYCIVVNPPSPVLSLQVCSGIYLSPQVCSGWSQVTWRLPQDSPADGVVVEDQGSSSVLWLFNVTWMSSGRYTCEEVSSYQSREVDIFIPGQGALRSIILICIRTIPCVVSDPRLNVSLFERGRRMPVTGLTYKPGHGFTGPLNDTSYVSKRAAMGSLRCCLSCHLSLSPPFYPPASLSP